MKARCLSKSFGNGVLILLCPYRIGYHYAQIKRSKNLLQDLLHAPEACVRSTESAEVEASEPLVDADLHDEMQGGSLRFRECAESCRSSKGLPLQERYVYEQKLK